VIKITYILTYNLDIAHPTSKMMLECTPFPLIKIGRWNTSYKIVILLCILCEDRTTFDGGRGLDRQLGRGEEEGGSRGEQEAQAYSLHSFGKGSGYRMWNNIL